MLASEGSWSAVGSGGKAMARNDGDGAYIRARDILRSGEDLTIERFHELDRLFQAVSHDQFAVLTDDPLHLAALRKYETLSWRQGRPAALVALMLVAILAVAGAMLLVLR